MNCNPLYTATVNGRPVRFFRSPLTGPDFPWHAMGDLLLAVGFTNAEAQRTIGWYRENWPGHTQPGAADAVIGSDPIACSIFDAFRPNAVPRPWEARKKEYLDGLALTFAVQNAHLSREEVGAQVDLARLRHARAGSA